ncbi:hypothetical protein [Prauserella aidingensis]|uniref:hypothetical protein n=1 Tax=Prauserella aidingensis TaxID=387890 RepID=UPI0020A328B2|nr:hypothetical protein [Prauserella aidingensis]
MAAWLDNPQHTSVQTEPATALDAPEVTIAFVPWAPGSPMKQAADGDRPTIRDTFRPKCPKCGRDVPMRQETARRCFTALAENDVPELDISALR